MYNQFQDNKKLRIVSLMLQETGTYNPMYIRPYTTHVTHEAAKAITERVESTGEISASTFSGLSGNILMPAASNTGEIPIPNGWSEKRLSFILTLEATSTITGNRLIYVQGFTDYAGVAHNGAIDPRMNFFINSILTVARNTIQTPMGVQSMDRVIDSAQVINGRLFTDYSNYNQGVYGLRPYDIFVTAQVGTMTRDFSTLNDTRVRLDTSSNPAKTSRKNNVPTSYLASLVDNYNKSMSLAEFGGVESDIYSKAASLSTDGSVNNNDFIRAIEMYSGIPNSTFFNIGTLEAIDGNVGYVTNYVRIGNTQMVGLHSAGQTEHWGGANRETIVATLLSNAIPALMLEFMINKIAFRSTNYDIGGQMSTLLIDAKSITNLDLSKAFVMFKHRLENEILYDLTYGNQISYMLEMQCDVFGESRITITLDSGPTIQYATPSFCDSLITPVYTTDKNVLYTVCHDVEQIFSQFGQNGAHGQQMAVNSLI